PGMAASLVRYYSSLDRMLLASDMGPGEYRYLYSLTYFAWLSWDPLASAEVRSTLEHADLLKEAQGLRGQYGKLFARQLDNTRAALQDKPKRTPLEEGTLQLLNFELADAQRTDRFPFMGQVPEIESKVLEPYRARLQASIPQEAAEILLDLMSSDEKRGHRV